MKAIKKIISLVLTLMLILSAVVSVVIINASAESTDASDNESINDTNASYGLSEQIEGSQILHCWCWDFNTIKNEMPRIALAGFSAIQTSPISECLVGEDGGMQLMGNGKWYYHYQPIDYKIGNYQLGTLDEFKDMCRVAEEYGVKVIVDAVVNHTTSLRAAVSDNVRNIEGGAFHNRGYLSSYYNREVITQQDLLGLCDLNTANPNVQNYILSFLKDCVSAGASGFRYDAAKHIELPTDDPKFASDFWTVALDNGAEFQYGEVIQDASDVLTEYSELMHIITSSYGDTMQRALMSRYLKASDLESYQVGAISSDRLVPWIESHDTYTGGNSWTSLSKTDTVLGWAVIASREGTTPLYFARPDGSSTSDQWGKNTIGIAGDGTYYSDSVTAVNRFKNEMIGQSERLSNPNENYSVLMIERGTKGAVIVNASEENVSINAETVIADGTYTDQVSKNTFTVKDGIISGDIKKRSVAVVYNSEITYPTTVSLSYTDENIHNGIDLRVKADNAVTSYYTVNDGERVSFENSASIDISGFKQNDTICVSVYATSLNGETVSESRTYKKLDTPIYDCETAVYFNDIGMDYESVYIYLYRTDGDEVEHLYSWPGVQMSKLTDNFFGYIMPDWDETYVLFNNAGGKQIPLAGEAGFLIKRGEHKLFSFSELTDYTSDGKVIGKTEKSFDGKEYIYFDPSPCSWFISDDTVTVIKIDEKEFVEMEQVTLKDGKTILRYLPKAGTYDRLAIGRQVGATIYNLVEIRFDGDKNLLISESDWKNGGSWQYLDESSLKDQPVTDPTDQTLPTETTAPTDPQITEVTTNTEASTTASEITTSPVIITLMYGDADQNGNINVKDATLIQKHIASICTLDGDALLCADTNFDGRVNIKDATVIQKFVAGIIDKIERAV